MKAQRLLHLVAFITVATLVATFPAIAAETVTPEPAAVELSAEENAATTDQHPEGVCSSLQSEASQSLDTGLTSERAWMHSGVDCTTTYQTVSAGCCSGNQKRSKFQRKHCCTVSGGRTCHTDTLSTWCSGSCPN